MARRLIAPGLVAAAALAVAIWALFVLEGARAGIEIGTVHVGATPVTTLGDGSDGPVVVVAHGFAGSRQMMLAYGQTLARAGYRVWIFDFEGHGRHPEPMRGDVDAIEGTTQRLVDQTLAVIGATGSAGPVALMGHSMATDILVRVAQVTEVGPMVLLSAFSNEITATHPRRLLLVSGAWEPGLSAFALEAARMVDPGAEPGQTVGQDGIRRAALIAPYVEHVAILHSRAGQRAALDWFDAALGRQSAVTVPPTGWALLCLLGAITALAYPLSRCLPAGAASPDPLGSRRFLLCVLVPTIAAPLLAAPVDTRLLPVLVADYLALHLALYGGLQLALLWSWRGAPRGVVPLAVAGLVLWALGVFGVALDRYGANFWPTTERLWIIAALALGALPFMLADAWLAAGAPLWQRIVARTGFLVSLAIAVTLDFEGLFFLIMIAPVIVLFWFTMGLMGRFVSARSGALPAGLGLGLVLAWALGVSFPLFEA